MINGALTPSKVGRVFVVHRKASKVEFQTGESQFRSHCVYMKTKRFSLMPLRFKSVVNAAANAVANAAPVNAVPANAAPANAFNVSFSRLS